MPGPFDTIFRDAALLPAPPTVLVPDRSRFELDAERSGAHEVDARFQLGTIGQRAISPISASYRNRQFQYELTDRLLDPVEAQANLPIPRIISRFYFKPLSYAVVSANLWVYAGYRVVPHPTLVGSYTQDTVPNLDDPPEVDVAYNTAEMDNDGENEEGAGMNVSSASYVSCNLEMLPIKLGVYPASRWLLPMGELRVWFHGPNDHDRSV